MDYKKKEIKKIDSVYHRLGFLHKYLKFLQFHCVINSLPKTHCFQNTCVPSGGDRNGKIVLLLHSYNIVYNFLRNYLLFLTRMKMNVIIIFAYSTSSGNITARGTLLRQ